MSNAKTPGADASGSLVLTLPELPIKQARIDEYLDVWAIEPVRGGSLADAIRRCDWQAHLATWKSKQADLALAAGGGARKPYALTSGGIAVVGINGPMMKQVGSMEDGTSTIATRRQIRAATNDDDVKGILLVVDSPGGTVSGTAALADDVWHARSRKPTATFYEDLGASAAVWVGSQTHEQSANRTAAVGSIGVYTVVHDLSKLAEQEGIGVFVISSGKFKGLGVPGTKVNEDLLAELQKRVDGLAAHFIQAVGRGRGMSLAEATEIADGRVHSAADAKQLKLIDRVESFDEALAALERRINGGSQGRTTMSTESNTAPVAATLEQLEAACPGAKSDFLIAQVKGKATCEQAQTAFIKSLSAEVGALNEKLVAAEAKATAAEARATEAEGKAKGVTTTTTTKGKHDPLVEKGKGSTADDEAADPTAKFDALVATKVAGGMKRQQAVAAVVNENPELHAAYVEAHNARIATRKAS